MRRRARSILAAASLLMAGLAAAPIAQAEQAGDDDGLSVWHAKVTKAQVPLILAAGADAHELSEQVPDKGTATVELYLTEQQAGALREQGIGITEHTISGTAENRVAAAGDGVFRPYGGETGLKREILATAQANPALTKVVSIGKTLGARTSSPSSSARAPRSTRTAPSPPRCICPTSTPASGSPRR